MKIKGIDIFIVHQGIPKIPSLQGKLQLTTIFNRGTKIFPGDEPSCHLTDVHQCRFESADEDDVSNIALEDLRETMKDLEAHGFHWCETHNLYNF